MEHFAEPKAFIGLAKNIKDFCQDINNYNPKKDLKILILFDDITRDMIGNKTFEAIVIKISIIYIFFEENSRLNATHCFIIKISYKRELPINKELILSHIKKVMMTLDERIRVKGSI